MLEQMELICPKCQCELCEKIMQGGFKIENSKCKKAKVEDYNNGFVNLLIEKLEVHPEDVNQGQWVLVVKI